MKKVALKIAYIGTNFYGFQRQPNLRTIEGEIIYVLKKLGYFEDPKDGKFSIAGRTDRGVHSLGNVISFMSEKELLINQINHKLPDDIQLIAYAPVRYGFRPRYAMERHYRYMFFESGLNIESMKELAKVFIGEHDFTNFTKRDQKTPIRTIDKINFVFPQNRDIGDIGDNNNGDMNIKNNNVENIYNNDINKINLNKIINYTPIMGKTNKYKSNEEFDGFLINKDSNGKLIIEYSENISNKANRAPKKGFNKEFNKNINKNSSSNSGSFDSFFIDVYGESFLWNMIRKMMRIFLLVGRNQMEIEEVEGFFNPNEKYNIKPLESHNLILMDTNYDNLNFKYDDYACEKFRRYLIDKMFHYKMNLSIENNMLNSMENIINNRK